MVSSLSFEVHDWPSALPPARHTGEVKMFGHLNFLAATDLLTRRSLFPFILGTLIVPRQFTDRQKHRTFGALGEKW